MKLSYSRLAALKGSMHLPHATSQTLRATKGLGYCTDKHTMACKVSYSKMALSPLLLI